MIQLKRSGSLERTESRKNARPWKTLTERNSIRNISSKSILPVMLFDHTLFHFFPKFGRDRDVEFWGGNTIFCLKMANVWPKKKNKKSKCLWDAVHFLEIASARSARIALYSPPPFPPPPIHRKVDCLIPSWKPPNFLLQPIFVKWGQWELKFWKNKNFVEEKLKKWRWAMQNSKEAKCLRVQAVQRLLPGLYQIRSLPGIAHFYAAHRSYRF